MTPVLRATVPLLVVLVAACGPPRPSVGVRFPKPLPPSVFIENVTVLDVESDGDADLAAAFSQDSEGVSGHGAVMVSDVDTLLIAWPWPGLPAEALG